MNMLTITEKCALLALNANYELTNKRIRTYLIASMIVEMILDNNIKMIDKDKFSITINIPNEEYNKLLYYDFEKRKEKEISLKKVFREIYTRDNTFASFAIGELEEKLLTKSLIKEGTKKFLFVRKRILMPEQATIRNLIDEVKQKFLTNIKLNDEDTLFLSLVSSMKLLNNELTKEEVKALGQKAKEIKSTCVAEKVKAVTDTITAVDTMAAAIIASVIL